MTTYQRLVESTAKISDVRNRVTRLVDDEVKSVLGLLDAIRRYERQKLPGAVTYHGDGSAPYYKTAIELGVLKTIEPPAGDVNRWPLLGSTPSGRRIHNALERQGYDFAPGPVSTEAD